MYTHSYTYTSVYMYVYICTNVNEQIPSHMDTCTQMSINIQNLK